MEVTRPIATVRIDGVARLSMAGWNALRDAFEALSPRRDVSCVVVSGTAAHLPVQPEPDRDEESTGDGAWSTARAAALTAVRSCEHPTLALIEGYCVGVGLDVAACCDLRVCSESSRFGRVVPTHADTALTTVTEPVKRLLGDSPVLRLLGRGELIGARRARAVGLVHHVHPDGSTESHGYGLAARIAAGAPLVNRWHKRVQQQLAAREGGA